MTKPIVMSFARQLPTKIPTEAYEIEYNSRLCWLERLCVWFLKKTKCLVVHFDEGMDGVLVL